MTDLPHGQPRLRAASNAARDTLAIQMAAFEATVRKTVTSPIRTGAAPIIPWRIHCPDEPKKAAPPGRSKAMQRRIRALTPEYAEARRAAKARDRLVVRTCWT